MPVEIQDRVVIVFDLGPSLLKSFPVCGWSHFSFEKLIQLNQAFLVLNRFSSFRKHVLVQSQDFAGLDLPLSRQRLTPTVGNTDIEAREPKSLHVGQG